MKYKTFYLIALFFFSLFQFAGAQTCNKITYTYDDNGNRTSRQLIVYECGGGARKANPEIASFPISVYPNPTMDKLNIGLTADTTVKESTIEMIDINGKTVYSSVTPALQIQVDTNPLAEGVYILKVSRGKKFATYNVKKTS